MILRMNSDDSDGGPAHSPRPSDGHRRIPADPAAAASSAAIIRPGPAVDLSLNELFLRSSAARPPLRIGILVDGDELPAYVRRIIVDIQRSNFARVVYCVRNGAPEPPHDVAQALFRRLAHRLTHPPQWSTLAYALYLRYVDSRHQPQPNPHELADCKDLLLDAEVLLARPVQTGFVDRLETDDVERVRAQKLDVLFRFGFRILRGGILGAAAHGVWSYHHGDNARYRGGPAHMWELIEGNPISGVVLQRLNESLDAGAVLAKGLYATNVSLSMTANRFAPYWSSEHFVIRALHELHTAGRVSELAETADERGYRGRRTIYRKPTNTEVARWLLPAVAVRAARAVRRRTNDPALQPAWHIGIRRSDTPLYRSDASVALSEFTWLANPPNTYRADPFLLERGSATWIFYEEFDAALGRGTIGCARVTDRGELEECRHVFDVPYHLSYPHVFEHDGEVFMIPESHEAGRVDLFRARRFPDEWVVETTLLHVRAVDSTVFQHQDRWWMLASPRIVAGHAAVTYAFSASNLWGPWTLASHTPMCYDVRRARGAGRVFPEGADLWRPSQDCSESYGRALGFNKLTISHGGLIETAICAINTSASPGLLGVHSYNRLRQLEVVDGLIFSSPQSSKNRRGTVAAPR